MKLRLLVATLALPVFAAPALSQTTWVEVGDQVLVAPFNQSADTVDDWDVYLADGNKIGEVEEVLGADANAATALAIDFDGKHGFADRDVVVPLDQFTWTDNRLVLIADASSVQAMETYND